MNTSRCRKVVSILRGLSQRRQTNVDPPPWTVLSQLRLPGGVRTRYRPGHETLPLWLSQARRAESLPCASVQPCLHIFGQDVLTCRCPCRQCAIPKTCDACLPAPCSSRGLI